MLNTTIADLVCTCKRYKVCLIEQITTLILLLKPLYPLLPATYAVSMYKYTVLPNGIYLSYCQMSLKASSHQENVWE